MRAEGTNRSHGRWCAVRGHFGTLAAALAAVTALLLLASSPASALLQRGHEFSVSFGTTGSGGTAGGEPQFKEPSSVAVNESTGAIYVLDAGNNRIVQVDSAHHFVAAWGWGVKDGVTKAFQVCTTECHAGLPGKGKGQFHTKGDIAVDNSTGPSKGDVYVEAIQPFAEVIGKKEVEAELASIDKFGPNGELLETIKTYKEPGGGSEEIEEPNGITVAPNGHLWITNEEYAIDVGGELKNKTVRLVESEFGEEEQTHGIAYDTAAAGLGGLYRGYGAQTLPGFPTVINKERIVEEENSSSHAIEFIGIPTIARLDAENTTGVATEAVTGNVFLDHGTSIVEYDSSADTVQTFGSGNLTAGRGLAVNSKTETVLAADAGANSVAVFTPEPEGPPIVDEVGAVETSQSGSTLTARIDPHGNATVYAFRYSTGAVPSAGEPCSAPCVQVPVSPAAIGSGFGDVEPKLTEQHITGLSPSTEYHFRVFAINHAGGPEHVVEAEASFKTQSEAVGESLPDGRQYQLVSPPAKNGAGVQAQTNEGGIIQSAPDGSAITYVAQGAVRGTCAGEEEPQGNRAPDPTQLLSRRGADGWCTADIDTENQEAEGVAPGNGNGYKWFSDDLSLAAFEKFGSGTIEHPRLSAEATERTPYLRHNTTCAASPSTCFQPIVTSVPGGEFGSKVRFVAATPDMRTSVIRAEVPLNSEPTVVEKNLYRWDGEHFKLISVGPNGQPLTATDVALGSPSATGAERLDVRNAISTAPGVEGTRFFFTTMAGTTRTGLFMRDMSLGAEGTTIRIDKGQGIAQEPGQCTNNPTQCERPVFQIASKDGSVVFFSDETRLTADSLAGQGRPDLYACQVTESGCQLTDLTPGVGGVAGYFKGYVLGAGEDGKTVYYVANGPIGGAPQGNCVPSEAEGAKQTEDPEALKTGGLCNLFVAHYEDGPKKWATPQKIAQLSSEDEFDWSGLVLMSLTSRVSPNGNWLAFMSDRNLTGYNTNNKTSGRATEEVYLFNASTEELRCASCNPTGARPEGVFDKEFSGEGIGLQIDRPLRWTLRWLSANLPTWTRQTLNTAFYQSRYLDDRGRLFFNSAEALNPRDTNGKADVYQYEPLGLNCSEASSTFDPRANGCVSLISNGTSPKESSFLDASLNGDDVFFITADPLVTNDQDTSYDVYDASVCGVTGRPACLVPPAATPPACLNAEECKGPPPPGPPPTSPSGASGGNGVSSQHEVLGSKEEGKPTTKPTPKPLTRAQKLAKALKSCKKIKKKPKRQACEKAARKKYGAKKHSKKAAHKSAHLGR
jgi:DNA-binding beta-propeller fold protein YncE